MNKKTYTDRKSSYMRETKETKIKVNLNLDGSGKSKINTGMPFMDHMLELFSKHGFFDLEIEAEGDLDIDCHHSMEDIGLCLGEALNRALNKREGIKRYGYFILPMDETLILTAVDLSKRPYLVYDLIPTADTVGGIDSRLFHEFFQAFCVKAGANLHIKLLAGEDIHHIFEGVFKSLAKTLDNAVKFDSRLDGGVFSTKGVL
jgi:imidazoleglycerol-phosphate dehydratase